MNNLIGKKCIVRGDRSGVFFGTVTSMKKGGKLVQIQNARNIWYWNGAASVMQLALDGSSNKEDCKITVTLDEITLTDVIQIIPCTDKAIECWENIKEWKK